MNLKKIAPFCYSYKLKGMYRFDLKSAQHQYSEPQMNTTEIFPISTMIKFFFVKQYFIFQICVLL